MNRFLTTTTILFAVCQTSFGQSDVRGPDEAAIRSAIASFADAYHRGDAKDLADHWAEDAVYIDADTGERFEGRQAIEARFASQFENGGSTLLEVFVESIRFLTPDVAIEDGRARTYTSDGTPVDSGYSAVHVKRDGEWKLARVQETALPEPPSSYAQLKQLEWMIGEWVDQTGESTITTVCKWTKNRNFMTRSFKVSVSDRIELEGTQVIGWDPVSGRFRSWMFDSDGGFGEGDWSHKDENRWVVKVSQTLSDGRQASAVNIFTRIDASTFTWQSIGRQVDGEFLPNIDEVTVVRKNNQ